MVAEWVNAVALLLIPTFAIVLSIVQIPPRKALTSVASAEAARAYAQSPDPANAIEAAISAATDAIVAEGGDKAEVRSSIDVSITPDPLTDPVAFCPGNDVTITVSLPVPVSFNPYDHVGGLFPISHISSSSTERIDDYATVDNDNCP